MSALPIEALELRRLFAASLNEAGVLRISGTEGDDDIRVATWMRLVVDADAPVRTVAAEQVAISVTINGVKSSFAGAEVTQIRVSGGSGDDRIRLDSVLGGDRVALVRSRFEGRFRYSPMEDQGMRMSPETTGELASSFARAIVDGGAGHDAIAGGLRREVIRGGEGNDTIRGGAGNDSIWGDDGDDVIFGDAGRDRIEGGSGNDAATGGTGHDRIEYQSIETISIGPRDGRDTDLNGTPLSTVITPIRRIGGEVEGITRG
jgi:Ca2+-binding RTX toxin-like protein